MRMSVAIVGMGGAFPGARDLDEFWSNIAAGRSAAREVPEGRWVLAAGAAYAPPPASGDPRPDKVLSTRGCFLDGDALIEADLGCDPALLDGLDPLFRLTLVAGLRAWRSGRSLSLDRKKVGIILGNIVLPTAAASRLGQEILEPVFREVLTDGKGDSKGTWRTDPKNRYVAALPAGLLAWVLGLGGGTRTLDAACASSLYAIKLAADELSEGRLEAVLAGGVSRPDSLYTQMGFSQLRALSPSGRCAPFDAAADGLVVGEGAAVFLLKTLDRARADGDEILGVIRGAGLSNDLEGNLLQPSSEGQLRALRRAYGQSGWSVADVDLIECHGTGTPVGDAVELASLKELWRTATSAGRRAVLGSVKSNVGHLLTAAGGAGLMKVLLALRNGTFPPTANYRTPNPALGIEQSPFEILSEARPWSRRAERTPRRAAINAFGFGGINAHLLVEEWLEASDPRPAAPPAAPVTKPLAIAVIGSAATFGEDGRSVPAWWGIEGTRWFKDMGFAEIPWSGPGLGEIRVAPRFRIPPTELAEMLPQQLLMLDVAALALADSGLKSTALRDERMGAYVGIGLDLGTTRYHFRWSLPGLMEQWRADGAADWDDPAWLGAVVDSAGPPLSANRTIGALGGIVASRIARELRLGGPSFTVSSEETSGLTALETAVRALARGDIDSAVVGAVDIASDPRSLLPTHAVRSVSPSGCCRPFDTRADGMRMGEGAAAVVLCRLEDAVKSGRPVLAVIRGIGVASGASGFSGAPTAETYRLALDRAYAEAGIDRARVGYLEAHGSGVPVEDQAEAMALAAFLADRTKENPCIVGSVKTVVGHTGAAAGLAGLVQALSCLRGQLLPALGEAIQPVPSLARDGILLLSEPRYWARDRRDGPRIAGVSALGVDGNCVHVVLEEATTGPAPLELPDRDPDEGIFLIRGEGPDEWIVGLEELGRRSRQSDLSIAQLARLWFGERGGADSQPIRVALVAGSHAQLQADSERARAHLHSDAERASPPPGSQGGWFFSPRPLAPEGKLAFVFPGSGNQFAGMGRELVARWPVIARRQDDENLSLRSQIAPWWFWDAPTLEGIEEDPKAIILGQVALGTLVSDLLVYLGVEPRAALGYSLGESAALFALRAWRERDEMWRRIETSTLFRSDLVGECRAARQVWRTAADQPVGWLAGVWDRSAAEVRAAIGARADVYLLISNAPGECLIGGRAEAVLALVGEFGGTFVPLSGVSTVHCELARPIEAAYRALHLLPTEPVPGVDFYSAAWSRRFELSAETAADSVTAQAMATVDFPRVIETAYADGVRLFVEIGPGNSCTRMIGRILAGRPHWARSACVSGPSATGTMAQLLAALAVEGVPTRLDRWFGRVRPVMSVTPDSERAIRLPIGGPPISVPWFPRKKRASADHAAFAASESVKEPSLALASAAASEATARAHEAFLRFSERSQAALVAAAAHEMTLVDWARRADRPLGPGPSLRPSVRPFLDRRQCLAFAVGKLGDVLGPDFALVDSYPTRVRLPDEPLMLVDRILSVEGEPRSMTRGRIVTEHDVLADAWYLDGGRIPTSIAVEAGQADLFLSGYLGIDFETKGLAVYRLLDAVVTFHDELPAPGTTVRYDIHIDRFFEQGGTRLFHFRFDAHVNGRLFLSMRDGCAGFFSQAELDSGKGIVAPALARQVSTPASGTERVELVSFPAGPLDEVALAALRTGDLASAFGTPFDRVDLERPARLPGGRMTLIDRVTRMDPRGGRFGLGLIRAEADIYPDAWFLTCHFIDDPVMPGTLMYECCLHTLRVFLMRLGWVGEEGQVVCQPVPGVASRLKCRGQVLASTSKAAYEVTIKELGYRPEPYAIVDALMFADDKPIVEITDMSLRMTGLEADGLEALWRRAREESATPDRAASAPPLYDAARILALSIGNPSEAFGEPYRVFDRDRKIARLPGPPYLFLDRITQVEGKPFELAAGAVAVGEYDVPADAWYFEAARRPIMPFAVLLEIALQPCGWLAAYAGSALTSAEDLSFRNLGGSAIQFAAIGPDAGTLVTRVRMTKVARSGGMIIQNFDFCVSQKGRSVYEGDTYFGFFTKAALAQQVGIRDARFPLPEAEEMRRAIRLPYPTTAPFPDPRLRMIEEIDCYLPEGGSAGSGYLEGSKRVDPADWFFKAHFYQDPVCPGSLGLESFLQLLQFFALERWGTGDAGSQRGWFPSVAVNTKHRWVYRGQVVPTNDQVTVRARVQSFDDRAQTLIADGMLLVDGKPIYQMHDFAIRLAAPNA